MAAPQEDPKRRLRRPHRKRARHGAAKERDERAAFHLLKLQSIASIQGANAGYRIGEGQSAGGMKPNVQTPTAARPQLIQVQT